MIAAFEVSVAGTDWTSVINAPTRGKAKSEYWSRVVDAWSNIPFTAIRCRRIGAPVSSPQFISNAVYRGMPGVRCGDRCRVGESIGTIVGHNSSANFDVYFDSDAPKYAGLTLNVHPMEIKIIPPPAVSVAA